MVLDLENAESIFINNKEVKQLKIGDTVIWEKVSIENLILSANKDAVTSGDTVILSAQLADANHDPIAKSGKTIEFRRILFEDTYSSYTTLNTDIGDDYYIELEDAGIGIGSDTGAYMFINSSSLQIYNSSMNKILDVELSSNDIVHITADYIYINETQYTEHVTAGVDISNLVSASPTSTEGTVCLYDDLGSSVTNSSGLANVSYLVQDTNALNIRANYGMILSETYIQCYTKIWKLDGTETKTQITGTTTIKDGIMKGGSAYLTDYIIDNSKNWEITLDASFGGSGSAFVIVKQGTKARDENRIMYAWQSNTSQIYSTLLIHADDMTMARDALSDRQPSSTNTYAHFIIKKEGNIYSISVNNYLLSASAPDFASICPNLCIGVDTWGSSCSLKNIKIKYL